MPKSILLVEDNDDDAELTIRALRKNSLDVEVIHCRNGEEAVKALINPGPESPFANSLPTAILLDLKLPRLDGLEVLARLRDSKRTKYIPVVVLTSSNLDEDMVKSYDLRANAYVRKPVDFRHFVDAISHIGLFWLLVNNAPERVG